ncbi:MAG: hypothetical protein A2X11_13110 [Bacteroidetes bacterium GWE2_42_24]|nr:MAG: hypothetical protein A2X11_13110 [Bacteroidetes bacterium GWE2_42_24]OFY25346.1 MAG: hypothetical protein A2X09_10315 [Bacteroidetes bacterium GWF2_43_11]
MIARPSMAQQGEMKLGAGLAYGSEIKSIGIGAKFHYGITDQIRLAPGFVFFLPKTDGGVKQTLWNLDLDGNYIFMENKGFTVHGIGGVNVSGYKITTEAVVYEELGYTSPSVEVSETKFGFNLGAGLLYPFSDRMHLLVEGKYVISDFDQIVISAGLMFNL